jgi:hypothetical protein
MRPIAGDFERMRRRIDVIDDTIHDLDAGRPHGGAAGKRNGLHL